MVVLPPFAKTDALSTTFQCPAVSKLGGLKGWSAEVVTHKPLEPRAREPRQSNKAVDILHYVILFSSMLYGIISYSILFYFIEDS